jgi:hypothetical protein
MKTKLIVLLLLVNVLTALSLDTTSTKYYPLKIGNSWTYRNFETYPPAYTKSKRTIMSTFTANGHLFYLFSDSLKLRIDSMSGNLLSYTTNNGCPWLVNEYLVDSLASKYHDSSQASCWTMFQTHCADTSNQLVFGINRKHKKFYWTDYFEHGEIRQYARGIGLIHSETELPGPFPPWHTLIGCVIDGIVYGDTSITGINSISTEIPGQYSLYQNYPNPFNPVTNIKFEIPLSPFEGGKGDVKLVIFNIQGKEITTLVNQQLSPGTYEVEWNASSFPSGVYFYKLESSNFSETKKMVLIK